METGDQPEGQLVDESLDMNRHDIESETPQGEPEPLDAGLSALDDFRLMSALLDTSTVLIVILDRQGRVRGFSRACEEATGYTFEDVWGKHVWDLPMIPDGAEAVKAVFEKLRAGQSFAESESWWLTKHDDRRLIAWSNTGLFDGQGSLEYIVATGMDITEGKQAEEEMLAWEERCLRLMESSPDAIFVHYQGNIVFANKAAIVLLGASSPNQVIGKPVLDFVHPEDRATIKERLKKILEQATELPLIGERLVRLDETEVRLEADAIFPFMYEGRPALQVVARAIPADKDKDPRLEEAERYRQLFDTDVAGVYYVTLDGQFLDCNNSFAQMLGYESREEVLEFDLPELYLDPADYGTFTAKLEDQGSLTNFELRLQHRGGSPLQVRGNASLIDKEGGAALVLGTLIESSRYQQHEDGLRDARQLYDALASVSTHAVIVTDLRGRITDISHRMLELHGFESAEEMIGKSCFELVSARDHETAIANLQKTLKEGVVRNTQYTFVRKDGSHFPAELNTTLVRDARGDPQAFLHTVRDLTRQQWMQEAVELGAKEHRQGGAKPFETVWDSRHFADAARLIFNSCMKQIGATGGYVALRRADRAQSEIILSKPDALARQIDGGQQVPMRRLRDEVHRTGTTAYRNQLSGTEGERPTPGGQLIIDNALFAPLVIEGKVRGLLGFANKPGGFTENDARVASAFGELATLALHNTLTAEALEASEARFRSVSEIADRAIISVDSKGLIVTWNRGAEVIFGYSAQEAFGKRLTIGAPGELRQAYQKAMSQVASAGGFAIVAEEVAMDGRRKDGSEFPLQLSLAAWKTREGVLLTSSIHDITKRRLAEHAVQQLADHDPVTGLANRTLFTDCLTQALANVQRTERKLAVIMLDLDRFMDINHRLGHDVGDRLLKSVGNRLTSLLRTGDTVARLGGDEFMLLMPGIGEAEHATKITQKIVQALRRPFLLDGHELNITASIGIAVYPEDGRKVDTLIRNADLAMCRVKEQGGDNFRRSAPARGTRDTDGLVLVT
jgi:diguanylate cyclase (GGDEF)-like protein/PAS domain S-box-containing protein